ncbi:thiamine-phosphate kinase [Actinomyces urinae]|uniref:thiamine-phosphate kinase n=1 Tax=Actinomyces urinae TaxID=1689268 RepID=UPI000931B3A4|nr:thiamine-phosphate kinase [Actinomyces urinae]
MSSEGRLIARMREVLPEGTRTMLGSGDDCALLEAPEGSFLVTADALVEGRHFRRDWSTPGEIGARAAAQNLADIAACGGRASGLVVAMVIPPGSDEDWLIEVVSGFGSEVAKTDAGVVGGDITGGEDFTLAVTAFGYATRVVTRSGGQVGDTVALAGDVGVSGVGLGLLQRGLFDPQARGAALGVFEYPVSTYRVPKPPLNAGPRAAVAGASAMMDISDGLGLDLSRLGKASGVCVSLQSDLLTQFVSAHEPWLDLALEAFGMDDPMPLFNLGEDHCLVATFPPRAPIPEEFVPIGTIAPGTSGLVVLDGEPFEIGGWDHLANGFE